MEYKTSAAKPPAARETRTTRSRPALCSALLSLLEEQPFEQVTVREITARAGIGYATFFRHYPDKEALLQDLAAREIGKLLAMAEPILYTVDSRASAQALCAYLWEHRKLWAALLTGGAAAILKEEFVRQAQRNAADRTNQKSWLPGDLSVVYSVAATIEILAWWLKQNEPPSVKRMAEILDRLVITPSLARDDDAKS
ncbi:MAG: TetR/AcrR family transcriptional regulator [Rhizomicrobium sp.]